MAKRLVAIFCIVSGMVVGLLDRPGLAWAQAGYYVTPSFSVSESYDDNIFFSSSNRQDDLISRFTPGLTAGYQSAPFTLLGSYSFRSAVYADHQSLDSPTENQLATLQLKYLPTQILTIGFDGAYSRTSIPSELNQPNPATPFIPIQATTGILITRRTTTSYSFIPSIGYHFSALTQGTATYDYVVYEGGGISTTSQDVTLGLDRVLTPRDNATLKSYYRHFDTEPSGSTATSTATSTLSSSQDSYGFTVGWRHRFSERLDVNGEAGPRFTHGTGIAGESVAPEANATINWRFQLGSASVGYSRTELTAAGLGGAFTTQSAFASLAVDPIRFLHLSLTPRWSQNTPEGGGSQTTATITVYSVDAGATYQLTRWLSARLSYQYFSQTAGGQQVGGLTISHNLVTIGLDFGYPIRVY